LPSLSSKHLTDANTEATIKAYSRLNTPRQSAKGDSKSKYLKSSTNSVNNKNRYRQSSRYSRNISNNGQRLHAQHTMHDKVYVEFKALVLKEAQK